jgi:anti-repressor protein
MTEKGLQVFEFEGKNTRIVEVDGEPWWVAKDVCDVLDIKNTTQAVEQLDEDERSMFYIGRQGEVNIINESGLYTLILRSNKPEARRFRRWVTSEVLPSIRKHEAYMTPNAIEKTFANPDFIIRLAQTLKDEQARRRELEAKAAENHPKVLFADSVVASRTSILIGELAKLLRQNGIEIGQNRLFERFREEGYLMKEGISRNMPTQRSMELGLFEIKERTITNPDGSIRTTKTPMVTGRGQIYFINKFRGKQVAA